MNSDQQILSWLAIIGLIIGVMTVYKGNLTAIIFGPPATGTVQNPTQVQGGGLPGGDLDPLNWGNISKGGLGLLTP